MSTTPSTDVPSLTFDGHFRVPADVFSLRKFREWVHRKAFPEKGRASFIAGCVEVEMSPENLETHNAVLDARFSLVRERDEIGDFEYHLLRR
ncbi:MAG TPA: hypothetical protein VGX76_12650 [Pirellulales bacterium]|nr:hypothetical protein [Pirellulales bacterium]